MCSVSLVFYCFGLVSKLQFNDIHGACYIHLTLIESELSEVIPFFKILISGTMISIYFKKSL